MLNPVDNPGYFLTGSSDAIRLVRNFNHPQIRFQFDTYHLQLMEGNLIETLREAQDVLGHIQFADCPGRHEPGTGEIDFKEIAAVAVEVDYKGAVGLEYIPLAEGDASLAWTDQFNA
jgi:hydroxypyruvate isomerase